MSSIPAIIRDDVTDDQARALSLIENVQRADMSPLDKARAFQALVKQHGNIAQVCKKTGVSQTTVRKYVNLLQLPKDLQEQVTTGSGPTGIGLMAQIATTFKNPKDMRDAWQRVHGFSSQVGQKIIKNSGGNLQQLDDLVEQGLAGEFETRICHSIEQCPFIPEEVRPKVQELIHSRRP